MINLLKYGGLGLQEVCPGALLYELYYYLYYWPKYGGRGLQEE
jgi:hypothetical protein